MLPGERGVEFLKWLKGQPKYQDILVLMLTNVGEEGTVKECLELGAKSYLLKSHVTPKEVGEKILELYRALNPGTEG